jgi:hypothetical protein
MKLTRTVSLLLLAAGLGFGIFHTAWHDAGLLTVKLSNYGTFGSENCGIWPRGTSESYIFGAGIWVGGMRPAGRTVRLAVSVDSLAASLTVDSTAGFDSTRGFLRIGSEYVYYRSTTSTSFDSCVRGFAGSHRAGHASGSAVDRMQALVSMGYDPSSGFSEFAPGDLPNEPGYTDTLDRIYFSDNPNDTALWPLRTPGGDKVIVSNEDSYNVSNDSDPGRHASGGSPLGVKVIQRGFAWYYHYYEDFIFLTYLVINVSPTDSLKDLFTGVCCDADVGDATDDLVGSDAGRDLGYAWDSDFHENGWAHVPGYVGFDFLESPRGPGGQLGLTAFKILRNPSSPGPGVPDPANDLEAYLTVAGYDHPTGRYHPVDSISNPTDVRFIQCTGPFNLGPLDTGRVVIAVIYGADSTDLRGNSDLAQRLYDAHFITHKAWVLEPNGGGELSGDYTIRWLDSSATGAPLLADIGCSRDRGKTWRDIVTGIPSSGSYDWNTRNYPDGTRYLVRVTVYDTIAVGEDLSDSIFAVNNPGNGAPDVEYRSPQNGIVRGIGTIQWWAADPDHDTLTIDLLIGPDSVHWTPIATGLPNTGSAEWNSYRYPNGSYYLMVRASDRDTFATDHSGASIDIMNDHRPAGDVEHVQGGCNSMTLLALDYDSTAYTGHTYDVTFEPIGHSGAEPLYQYNLRDVTADTTLLAQVGLDIMANGQLFTRYSPIIDGFGLEFNLLVDKSAFRFTDFFEARNRSGFNGNLYMQGEDSLGIAPPVSGLEWACRGSEYYIRWKRVNPPDSLTIEVYDSTNCVTVPYNRTRGDCWQFGSGSQVGQYFNRTAHRLFYLDGGLFWFNRNNEMTVPPDSGDVWVIRCAGNKVPCQGNIYRFTTPVGVGEASDKLATGIYRIAPNPAVGRATIRYSLSAKQRISLAVFDISGRQVRKLADGIQLPGRYALDWNGADDRGRSVGAGIYFVKLRAGEHQATRKLVLTR